nr:hypothetical protein A6C57_22670 [Fibrella sp. ES10-3-2-2]
MNCPDKNCRKCFIAYYEIFKKSNLHQSESHYLYKTSLGNLTSRTFSDEIVNISSGFVKIYNEAFAAEQQSLFEICGVGYRKALEFLIKDYVIQKHPEKQNIIEKKLLGPCITDHVNDSRIKSVAKRAVWLGNDETHFIRRWEDKNLNDLKKLIDLTLHWIEAEVLTESFEDEMPE